MRNGKSQKNPLVRGKVARGEASQKSNSSPALSNSPMGVNGGEEMRVELVNLTPHEINIYAEDGKTKILSIPPTGKVARVTTSSTIVKHINNVPVKKVEYGEVQNLPDPQPNTVYIVSSLVLQALKGKRDDVVAPDTSPQSAVRDEQGRIIGVKGFIVL